MINLDPATLISRIIILVVAFSVHEFAHAWTANRFGDSTPRLNGRLTLNPLAHLDPMGSLLLLVAGFGWARPVPVNPYVLERRSRSALMWVSLAGPFSNLLLACLAAIPFQVGLVSINTAYMAERAILPTPSQFALEFMYINLLLMLFNLIPLAPLDGEKILLYLLPADLRQVMDTIRPYGPIILLVLVIVAPLFGFNLLGIIIGQPLNSLLSLLAR